MSSHSPTRYSPLWVTLHWITALLIFVLLYLGFASVNSLIQAKPTFLRWHMPIGTTVLILTIVRLFVRLRTPRPETISSGNPVLDKVAEGIHHLLYLLLFLIPVSGLLLSLRYNLAAAVFGTAPFPSSLQPFLHGILNFLLIFTLLIHILAALYHQFVRRDNLIGRMWYGK
ncbi:MAG: cytochrome b/b6 domain-containing protein [Candidatus Methanomethylicaceae archaeon]